MAVTQRKYKPNRYDATQERSKGEKFLRFIIVLVLLALIGLAGYSQYVGQTFLPENAIASVVTPVQSVFSRGVAWVSDYLYRLKLRGNIELEYNRIKAQNEQLMYDALLNVELENEVRRLEGLLGVYEENEVMDPILANVTARETGNWFSTFDLNRGSRHGVEVNMAVINATGLIGRVYEVFENSSKVITIIDSNSNIAGLLESSRDQGMVRGSLGIDGQPLCRMFYLPTDTVPRPGEKVITSGVGLPFPKGLVIGTVRESTRDMEEGKYYIVVEPEANFQQIEEVLVLRYVAEVEALPEGIYDQGELEIVGLPPAPSQAVIEESELVSTPAPLPGAPGRATEAPAPTFVPSATNDPNAALADPFATPEGALDPAPTEDDLPLPEETGTPANIPG